MGSAQSQAESQVIGQLDGAASEVTDIKHYEQGYYSFGSDEGTALKTYPHIYKIKIDKGNLEELKVLESLDLAFRRDNDYYVYDKAADLYKEDNKIKAKLFIDWILPGRLRRIRILQGSLPDTIAEENQLRQQILEIEQQIEELNEELKKIADIK